MFGLCTDSDSVIQNFMHLMNLIFDRFEMMVYLNFMHNLTQMSIGFVF